MIVTKKSPLTGQWNEKDLPITDEQLFRWENGELIQNVMPHISPEDREFLISGITPNEWEDHFGKLEEDEEDGYEDELYHETRKRINQLSREEIIEGLESIGIACYDDEPTSLLREAYHESVEAGDLDI